MEKAPVSRDPASPAPWASETKGEHLRATPAATAGWAESGRWEAGGDRASTLRCRQLGPPRTGGRGRVKGEFGGSGCDVWVSTTHRCVGCNEGCLPARMGYGQFTPGKCYRGPQSDRWLSVCTERSPAMPSPWPRTQPFSPSRTWLPGQVVMVNLWVHWTRPRGCQPLAHASSWV